MAISDICTQSELVNSIIAGDRQAEADLVERYSRGVRIIIQQKVRHNGAVEDLFQEAFRIVLEKVRRGDVREPERLSGFVCGVARNLTIDYFRRTARQENMTEIEEAEPLPHPEPNQLQNLLQKEKAELVRQALKEMPNERDIQVLYRFYIAEDEKEQICADLGLTNLHFNRVLHRARERFKELYVRAMLDKR
jgi:RNA polymerase sigma-70 factor, ECF subfamily